jgi:hypothetical protein
MKKYIYGGSMPMVWTNQHEQIFWPDPPQSEDEVVRRLKETPFLFQRYRALRKDWKERFLDFCEGKKTLPLTYDPFFKRIFHPDIHRDRLSRLISSLLGMNVRVVQVMPTEDSTLDGTSPLIMDILVELEDGSLVAVEIQKQGYAFPGERMSCYGADLLMRQYTRVKGLRGKEFSYRDIKKVYVIVIYEESPRELNEIPNHYIHYGKTVFDTGLRLSLLEEYCVIGLDVFKKISYSEEKSERNAWLSLLATEDLSEAEKLIRIYPWLEEIYEEMAMLRQNPEEVLWMYSEALKILDENMMKYVVEQQQETIKQQAAELEQKDVQLEQQAAELEQKYAEIAALKKQLANQENRK